ncbi:MAG TPA: FAD-dependent oxidoreductase [Gammaproteobacteria bacterium]|nr:FAD-dependent oxidoreductase [Gammaproteobacteria bacterium]
MKIKKILVVSALAAVVTAFFHYRLDHFFTLQFLQAEFLELRNFYERNPVLTLAGFALLYIAVCLLYLPGLAVLSLAAGGLFGLLAGTLATSIASTVGATCAFLVARFLLRDAVQKRFKRHIAAVNRGIERDGAFYLLTLRLVPIFPFYLINLVMGLTPIKTFTYIWISQLGMLPFTMVLVYAGTQLAVINSLNEILSPRLLGTFVLLGLFPWIAKALLQALQRRRIYRAWPRPESFDANLAVIGAGSAGLVSAYIAAAVKARVFLIEKNKMGGECLNTGCVPSKALLRAARFYDQVRRASDFGFDQATAGFRFARLMARVHSVISKIEPHDSVERYTQLGVDCIQGEAKIESPWQVRVGERVITVRNIIVATGSKPLIPDIPGLTNIDYLSSDNLWELQELPPRLLVLGGGPIGCELAQGFARLGSRVTQVEMQDCLLGREDPEVGAFIAERFRAEGIELLLGHRALSFIREKSGGVLICENLASKQQVRIAFDKVLLALGRRPDAHGFGLEQLGVEFNDNGTIKLNEYLQTRLPNIYACGDVAGPYQFTHTASHQAWYCVVNALFGSLRKFKVDYSVIPWATFTDPEVARAGLNETEARERHIPFETTRYDLSELDRAIADGEACGFIKVLTVPGKDRILGVTIVGAQAGELIAEYVLAMKHRIGLNQILGTIHIYPTLAEANKYAAGAWKKAHAPQVLLKWVERWQRWKRS